MNSYPVLVQSHTRIRLYSLRMLGESSLRFLESSKEIGSRSCVLERSRCRSGRDAAAPAVFEGHKISWGSHGKST